MEKSEFEKYMVERYQDQVDWYDKVASLNKQRYTMLQWGVIIISSLVPFLVVWLPEPYKWVTASLAVVLAIGTAGLKTFKFQENWINYRTTCETLKKEEHFLRAEIGDYASADDAVALFVERVELLIARENTLWATTHKTKKGPKGSGGA